MCLDRLFDDKRIAVCLLMGATQRSFIYFPQPAADPTHQLVLQVAGTPWGVTYTSVELGNGLTSYTLAGTGWGAALKAGASVKVGFSGSPGISIGNEGALTAAQLFGSVAPPSPPPAPPSRPITAARGAARSASNASHPATTGSADTAEF